MSPQPASARRRVLAQVACKSCRRLKMRCVGAQSPPCTRCVKVGRECVVEPASRVGQLNRSIHNELPQIRQQESLQENLESSDQIQTVRPLQHSIPGPSPSAVESTSTMMNPLHQRVPGLPSVYSLSPIELVESQSSATEMTTVRTSVDLDNHNDPPSPLIRKTCSLEAQQIEPPNDQQLCDLLVFFNERLLHNLPFLTDETSHNVALVVRDKRPLAYCAAFVAARFVPGYDSLRRAMVSEISDILELKHCSVKHGRDLSWMLLQAFGVLYAYAAMQPPLDDICSSGELSHWALKSTTEMFASRLALYRSAEELRATIKTNQEHAGKTIEWRRYIFWLWLFTMAHYSSLLMRMPPTIGIDMNIRSAPKLLQAVELDERASRILAEVELCLIWSQAGTQDQASNEWWCSPAVPADVQSTLSTLEKFDEALQKWRDRWLPTGHVAIPTVQLSRPILFHYSFTRFFASTYVTRLTYHQRDTSRPSTPGELTGPLPVSVIQLILRSVDAAVDCCSIFPSLSPLMRDQARYLADAAFALVAFSCFYIISAAGILQGTDISLRGQLQKVMQMAELMVQMATDEKHVIAVYGKRVLAKLSTLHHDHGERSEARVHGRSQHLEQGTAQGGRPNIDAPNFAQNGATNMSQLPHAAPTDGPVQMFDGNSWELSAQQSQFTITDDWFFLDTGLEVTAESMLAFDDTWIPQGLSSTSHY